MHPFTLLLNLFNLPCLNTYTDQPEHLNHLLVLMLWLMGVFNAFLGPIIGGINNADPEP